MREAPAQTGRGPHISVPPHSQPTLMGTRAAEGRQVLLGGRGSQGVHPAQAHQEGLRVLG